MVVRMYARPPAAPPASDLSTMAISSATMVISSASSRCFFFLASKPHRIPSISLFSRHSSGFPHPPSQLLLHRRTVSMATDTASPSQDAPLMDPRAKLSLRTYVPAAKSLAATKSLTKAPARKKPAIRGTASEREENEFWERVIAHQKGAARISALEESRTLVGKSLNAFLSTVSQKYEGFPYTSLLDVAAEEDGSLITAVSSLSLHTKDLQMIPKCCLLFMKDKSDRTDVVVTYIGEATEVPENDQRRVREVFLSKHPGAFWVDFGDFKFLRIVPKHIRFLTGSATPFNRSGEFSGDEFRNAKVDPISEFSTPIAAHMNQDHADETKLITEKALGVKVDNAKIIDLDQLGLNVQIEFQRKPIKLRVPFPRPAENRKDVKVLIVDMLEQSK